jgi:hypothetical protein
MVMKTYPRESVEFHEIPLLNDGDLIDPTSVAISTWEARPTTWVSPVTVDGLKGIMVSGLTPGFYRTWARVVDNPETPVVESESFRIT